jgi:hypothetical protein
MAVCGIAGMVLYQSQIFVLEKRPCWSASARSRYTLCCDISSRYQFIRRKLNESLIIHKAKDQTSIFPPTCLHKWKDMEIYLISVAIGVSNLITFHVQASMCIVIFSDVFYLFSRMSVYGAIQCRSLNPKASIHNLLGLFAVPFIILLVAFISQATAQYRKNVSDAIRSTRRTSLECP